MKKIALVLAMVMALVALAGCSGNGAAGQEKVTLNVLNWGDYIDEELLAQFTEETGIEVKYSTMASNEEMLAKLSAPDCIFDAGYAP